MSVVHVNRTLKRLRFAHGIEVRKNWISLPDVEGLQRTAGFDPGYLNLEFAVNA